MNTIMTVFRKELKDQLRDRRTIMFMIVIPLLVFPMLFKVTFAVQRSSEEKAKARTLTVALVLNGNASRLAELVVAEEGLEVLPDVEADSVRAWIRRGRLDGAYIVDEAFDETVADDRPGRVDLLYRTADEHRVMRSRLGAPLDTFEAEILEERFTRLGLNDDIAEGIDDRRQNIASVQEQVGKQVGGFLPYMFILFCFMGAMYPGIDLGAGEKERGTLETLLTAPVNRFHILVGKLLVITLSGLTSAIVAIGGLYVAFRQAKEIPEEFFDLIVKILGWDTIGVLLSLLLPLAVFFAGVLLSISLTARSFKEAQSLVTPLNMAIIVPAALGMLPGIEMNYLMAVIPVLNVSLATKELIAGTINTGHLVAVYLSLILLALGSL